MISGYQNDTEGVVFNLSCLGDAADNDAGAPDADDYDRCE